MKKLENPAPVEAPVLTNGSGAAAVLSAAVGCFALAVLAIVGDQSAAIRSGLIWYQPTGPLSGVSTCAILVWLFTWAVLEWRWRAKTVAARRINAVALVLLVVSIVLTFPPIGDLF